MAEALVSHAMELVARASSATEVLPVNLPHLLLLISKAISGANPTIAAFETATLAL
jgi:hypothetical protein